MTANPHLTPSSAMHSSPTTAESRLNFSVSVPPFKLDRPSTPINQDIALKLVSWIDDAKTLGRLATVNRNFKAVSKYPLKALRVVRRHTSQASSRALFMLNMHLCITDIYRPRFHLDGTMRRLKLYMGGELKRLSHRQTAPVSLDAALSMTVEFAHWPGLGEASFLSLCESAHSGVTSTSADEVERFEASITSMLDNAFSPLCHAAAAARLPELPMQAREPFIVRLLAYLDATATLSMDELGAIVQGLAGAPFIDEARPDESIALLSRLAERIVRLPLDPLAKCTVLLASGLQGLLMSTEATAIVKAIQEHLIDMESRLSRSLSKAEQAIAVGHLGRLQVGMAKSASRSAVFRRYGKLLTTESGWAGLGALAAGLFMVPAASQESQYWRLIARCSKLSPTSALRARLQIDAVLHGLSYMKGRIWSDLQSVVAAHRDPAVFKDAMGWLMKASRTPGFVLKPRTVQLILTQIESGSKGEPFEALANTSKLIRRHLAVEDARTAYRRLLDVAGSILGRQLGSFYIQESARANADGIHHAGWATGAIESSISSLPLQKLQLVLDELDDLAQAESIAPNDAYWMFDHIGACLVIAASDRSPTRIAQEIVPLGNQMAKHISKMQIALPRALQVPPELFERLMAKDFPADARILRGIALRAVFGESNQATESTLDRCMADREHLSSMRSFQKSKLFKAVLAGGNLDHANRLVTSVTTWKPDPLDLPEIDVERFVELLIKTRSPIPDNVINAIDQSFGNMDPLAPMTRFRERLAKALARPQSFSSLPPGSSACLIDHLTQLKSLIRHFTGRGEIEKALLDSYIPKEFREGGKIPQEERKEMKLIANLLGDFVNERAAATYPAQDDYFIIQKAIKQLKKNASRWY